MADRADAVDLSAGWRNTVAASTAYRPLWPYRSGLGGRLRAALSFRRDSLASSAALRNSTFDTTVYCFFGRRHTGQAGAAAPRRQRSRPPRGACARSRTSPAAPRGRGGDAAPGRRRSVSPPRRMRQLAHAIGSATRPHCDAAPRRRRSAAPRRVHQPAHVAGSTMRPSWCRCANPRRSTAPLRTTGSITSAIWADPRRADRHRDRPRPSRRPLTPRWKRRRRGATCGISRRA